MQFYVTRGGQQLGPFSIDQLRSHLLSGTFQTTDLAWHEGAPGWAPLDSYPAVVGPSPSHRSAGVLPPFPAGSQPQESSGLATASLVLGILAFLTVGLTSLPAVICGHISLAQIKHSAGRMSGSGLAIGGLITGYFGFLFLAAVGLGIALPIFTTVQGRAQSVKCLSEAKQIAMACKLYAMDHKGNYPPALDQLVPEYLPDKHIFECALRKGQPPEGYEYFGGKDTDPASTHLFSSRATTRDRRRIVATSDGAVALKRDQ